MTDYLIQSLWLAWLLVGLVYLILEMTNGDFYIMCFAIDSFRASLASVFTGSIAVHVIVFVIPLVPGIFLVWLTTLKYLHQGTDDRLNSADALVDRGGKVTDTIEADEYGRVEVDDDSWRAQSAD